MLGDILMNINIRFNSFFNRKEKKKKKEEGKTLQQH